MMETFVNFQEWLKTVPVDLQGDALWNMKVYRLAVFIGDLAWPDVTKLVSDRRTIGFSEQLYEAIGSVSANLAEGYSRSSGKNAQGFTSIRSVLPVKAATGITKHDIFWETP